MKEEWKKYHNYYVSNFGRIKNSKDKILSSQTQRNKGYYCLYYTLFINKKRCHCCIAPIVAELFLGQNKNSGRRYKCIHIDGDFKNCRADNLKISKIHTQEREEWQIKTYKENVIACCKHIFQKNQYFDAEKIGFDVDNCLSQCYLDIWITLPKLKHKNYFYTFCKYQCHYTFCRLYKKYQTRLKKEIRDIYLREEK